MTLTTAHTYVTRAGTRGHLTRTLQVRRGSHDRVTHNEHTFRDSVKRNEMIALGGSGQRVVFKVQYEIQKPASMMVLQEAPRTQKTFDYVVQQGELWLPEQIQIVLNNKGQR